MGVNHLNHRKKYIEIKVIRTGWLFRVKWLKFFRSGMFKLQKSVKFVALVVVVALVHVVVGETAVALVELVLAVLADASNDRVFDLRPLASNIVGLVEIASAGDVVDWVRHHLEDSVFGDHISAAEVVEDSATFSELLMAEELVGEVVHALGFGASLLDSAKICGTIDR